MQGPTRRIRMGDEVLVEVLDPEEGQWVCVNVVRDDECVHCGCDDHRSYQCPNHHDEHVVDLPEEPEPSIEDSPQYGDC